MTYPKVKPCPKCGDEPMLFGYEGHNGRISSWRVECDPCGYIGSCEGSKLAAIREHNRRVAKVATSPPEGGEGV